MFQEHKLFCVKGHYIGKIKFLIQLIRSVKDTFQITLQLQTEGLQSRARSITVTEKITEAGNKAGGAANEMGKEKDILRGFKVQENSHERMQGCERERGWSLQEKIC